MNGLTWEQRQALARQQAQQYNDIVARQKQPWNTGGNMYAGGDPGFNERTGTRKYYAPDGTPGTHYQNPVGMADYLPEPRNGDNYLQMLMKKYGGAAQGFGQEVGDWFSSRMPNANRQYQQNRNRFIDQRVDEP